MPTLTEKFVDQEYWNAAPIIYWEKFYGERKRIASILYSIGTEYTSLVSEEILA